MVDPNTRQGKRTPVTLKIKFKSETLEQFIERYAVDVSQGGIFIRTKEPLAVGTQMKFEFQLRDASPLIAGEGTVVWTRENDPSRPAIAPGMGVRFDRLADGSQGILERILTEKAKQAPQRTNNDTAKPPMFTDTPTRVAPAPIQEALLGKDGRSRRSSDEPGSDSHTPLPRPMPFHSDADEFPDEAFEEATKVRALDELIAQTAERGPSPSAAASLSAAAIAAASAKAADDDLITRRNGRVEVPVEPPSERAENVRAQLEAQEAPGLPNPPETSRPLPKLLDTSPSPRNEAAFVSETMSRTRLGVGIEPRPRSLTPGPMSGPGPGPMPSLGSEAPPLATGVRAVAAETTEPARMPTVAQNRSIAPIAILILLLIAAGGAAVWFFVIRPGQVQHNDTGNGSASGATVASGQTPVTPELPTSGSAGSGSAVPAGSAATAGSATPATTPPAVKAEVVDTVIASSETGSTVEIVGAGQTGPAPFTAKLDKGKSYQVRITAKGFAALELAVKGGDDKQTAKLVAKPKKITVTSDPAGALLWVDNSSTGHTTPFEIELTAAQSAKKSVHVQLRKSGFRTIDRAVDLGKMTEDDTQMTAKLDEKLSVQQAAPPPPPVNPNPPAGSSGAVTHPGGGTDGSAATDTPAPTPAPTPEPTGAATPPPTPAPSPSPVEPEPDFNKKP